MYFHEEYMLYRIRDRPLSLGFNFSISYKILLLPIQCIRDTHALPDQILLHNGWFLDLPVLRLLKRFRLRKLSLSEQGIGRFRAILCR